MLFGMRKLRIVVEDMADAPMTVVETARFLKDVKSMMSDSEREQLVAFLGAPTRQPVKSFRTPAESGRSAGPYLAEENVAAHG